MRTLDASASGTRNAEPAEESVEDKARSMEEIKISTAVARPSRSPSFRFHLAPEFARSCTNSDVRLCCKDMSHFVNSVHRCGERNQKAQKEGKEKKACEWKHLFSIATLIDGGAKTIPTSPPRAALRASAASAPRDPRRARAVSMMVC